MKNFEKYENELKKYDAEELCSKFIKPIILKKDSCPSDNCAMCCRLLMLWMGEEYKPEPPKVDWSKVEVDTPVLVKDSDATDWARRYFAKYEDGIVYVWSGGCTSWSAEGHVTKWELVKLAGSEVVLGHGGYHKERNYYCPKCDIYFPWDRRGAENKYCYNCGVELDWDDKKRMFYNICK